MYKVFIKNLFSEERFARISKITTSVTGDGDNRFTYGYDHQSVPP